MKSVINNNCYIARIFPVMYSTPIHRLVHGHMTSNNENCLPPWPNAMSGQHCENYDLKRETVRCYPRNVDRCCTQSERAFEGGLKPRPNDLNISTQHIPTWWPSICKHRSNDRNIWTQHIAALLGATCCTRLATLLRRVATCWVWKFEQVRMPGRNIVAPTWPNGYNVMQHPQMLHEKSDHFQIWTNKT